MGFADNMKAFTEDVRRSTRDRSATLADVNEKTAQLLAEARGLLQKVGQENRDRAQEMHAQLDAGRKERQQEVQQMRQDFVQEMGEMRQELHQLLEETRKHRHEAVNRLLHSARSTRESLASDLREASRLWHNHMRG
jgi:DNA anti-recombination protein RmuC